MSHFLRPIFALSFAAFMVASGLSLDAAPAERQRSASFDGLWSVVIVTLQGSCDRSYRYPVRIVGNRVLQAGADPGYRLYGAVSRSGAIRVGPPPPSGETQVMLLFVQSYGRGRARRWMTRPLPGFTTTLLLPGPLPGD
jgi:hypothetical protein